MDKPTGIQLLSQAALSATSFLVPVLAVALGADLFEVGLIGAAYGTAQFVASATGGRAADAHGRRRILKLGLLAATAASLLHLFVDTPLALAGARAAFGFAAGVFPPALLSLAYDRNRKLGRFTGWGGMGFALGAFIGALAVLRLADAGAASLKLVFLVSSALLAAAYAIAVGMRYPPEHDVVVHLFPKETIRRNLPAYSAMVLRHMGAAAVWVVFPLYLVDLGVPLAWVGFVHAANGVFQFLAMPRMDPYRPLPLVVWGCVLTAATFAGFMFARNAWHFLALQPVLALAWACLYMGTLKYVLDSEERATATGLLQSSVQFSNVAGPALGGVVAAAWGYAATFWVGIALSFVAMGVFLWEMRGVEAGEPTVAPAT